MDPWGAHDPRTRRTAAVARTWVQAFARTLELAGVGQAGRSPPAQLHVRPQISHQLLICVYA